MPPLTLIPDSKPPLSSRTIIANIVGSIAAIAAVWLPGAVITPEQQAILVTIIVAVWGWASSYLRTLADQPITGSPLADKLELIRSEHAGDSSWDASPSEALPSPSKEPLEEPSWQFVDDEERSPVIPHVTDHNEVMRLATQLPWPEFAALAIKLVPMLTVARDAAQKVMEQQPPKEQPPADPLDLLKAR